jgi:hypothetical protein
MDRMCRQELKLQYITEHGLTDAPADDYVYAITALKQCISEADHTVLGL